MRGNTYARLRSKYSIDINSIKSIRSFIHKLNDDSEELDEDMISFIYSLLNEATRKYGNDILYEFEYVLNENPSLSFMVFVKTILNTNMDDKFKSSFYSKISKILGESMDNFTIGNNKYFRELTDNECDQLMEFLKDDFHSLLIEPLYSSSSSAIVYQLNGINIDELIYNEFIDFTLLKNNIYRSEFNIKFDKLEFSNILDELESDLTNTKHTFIHTSDIFGYLTDFEYDNGGIFDYVNFDKDDDVYADSFDDARFQEFIMDTIRKLMDRKIEDLDISDFDHSLLDVDTTYNSSIIIRSIAKFIKNEVTRFSDKFIDKFFSDMEVSDDLRANYEIMEYDSVQTAKQFLLTLMTIINIHTLLHMPSNGYKSRRFILRSIVHKIHLLAVRLVDYGTCIFEPKISYKPFDWSDGDVE